MTDFIQNLVHLMAVQEGFFKSGTRPSRNFNPLDLWDGLCEGKTKRIWPGIPIDDGGFLIFPDTQTGWNRGRKEVLIKINRGMSLRELVDDWTTTDRESYLAALQHGLGIDPDLPLSGFIQGPTPDNPPSTQV